MYSSRSIALHRAAVTAIVLLAVGLVFVQARALWLLDSPLRLGYLWPYSDLIFSVYAGVLALVLSWKASHRPDARTAALCLAFLAVFLSVIVVPSGSASLAHEVTFSISYMLWAVLFLRFTMIFPSEISLAGLESLRSTPEDGGTRVRLRHLVNGAQAFIVAHPSVLWYLGAVFLTWAYLHTTSFASSFYLITPESPEALPFLYLVVGIGGLVFTLVALVISFLWTGYRLASAEERQKILWVVLSWVFGLFWAALGVALMYLEVYADSDALRTVSRYFWPAYYPGIWFALLTGMAVAILYSGAFDVRPLINKTTVYGTLGILGIVMFAALESLVSEVLEARLGLPDTVGAAASGAIVAALVLPLRGPFSRAVSRLLP